MLLSGVVKGKKMEKGDADKRELSRSHDFSYTWSWNWSGFSGSCDNAADIIESPKGSTGTVAVFFIEVSPFSIFHC
jgi:hypothetical protein